MSVADVIDEAASVKLVEELAVAVVPARLRNRAGTDTCPWAVIFDSMRSTRPLPLRLYAS